MGNRSVSGNTSASLSFPLLAGACGVVLTASTLSFFREYGWTAILGSWTIASSTLYSVHAWKFRNASPESGRWLGITQAEGRWVTRILIAILYAPILLLIAACSAVVAAARHAAWEDLALARERAAEAQRRSRHPYDEPSRPTTTGGS